MDKANPAQRHGKQCKTPHIATKAQCNLQSIKNKQIKNNLNFTDIVPVLNTV